MGAAVVAAATVAVVGAEVVDTAEAVAAVDTAAVANQPALYGTH